MPEPLSTGPNFPGFTILGPAGRGGMGTVFVAEQHTPRRTVALKVLTRAADPDTLAQFRREAAVIAELEHPRIVPLYSYGEHAGQPYLVHKDEAIVPARSGYVLTREEARSILGGRGGGGVNIGNVNLGSRMDVAEFVAMLKQAING